MSTWKQPGRVRGRSKKKQRAVMGPPSGTEHVQATAGMVRCTPFSRLRWESKHQGTLVFQQSGEPNDAFISRAKRCGARVQGGA